MKKSPTLDTHYFAKKLGELVRDLDHYTPDELARALVRLGRTAHAPVLAEEEFTQEVKRLADERRAGMTVYIVEGHAPTAPGESSAPGRPVAEYITARDPAEALATFQQGQRKHLDGQLSSKVHAILEYGSYSGNRQLQPRELRVSNGPRNLLVPIVARQLADHPDSRALANGDGFALQTSGIPDKVSDSLGVRLDSTDTLHACNLAMELLLDRLEQLERIETVVEAALEHAEEHGYQIECRDMALTGVEGSAGQMGVDLTPEEMQKAADEVLRRAQGQELDHDSPSFGI